jgi:hypothetical protein
MTIKNRNKLILEIILISSSNGQPINEVKLPPEFDKFLWKYGSDENISSIVSCSNKLRIHGSIFNWLTEKMTMNANMRSAPMEN